MRQARTSWLVASVDITLAPTEPAGVQFLEVTRMRRQESLSAAPVCR